MLLELVTCVFALFETSSCDGGGRTTATKKFQEVVLAYEKVIEAKGDRKIRGLKDIYRQLDDITTRYPDTEITAKILSSDIAGINLLRVERAIQKLDPVFNKKTETIVGSDVSSSYEVIEAPYNDLIVQIDSVPFVPKKLPIEIEAGPPKEVLAVSTEQQLLITLPISKPKRETPVVSAKTPLPVAKPKREAPVVSAKIPWPIGKPEAQPKQQSVGKLAYSLPKPTDGKMLVVQTKPNEGLSFVGEEIIVNIVAAAGQAANEDRNIEDAIIKKTEELLRDGVEKGLKAALSNAEVTLAGAEGKKPKFSVTTVQPLLVTENDRDTIFVQGSLASSDANDRTTANLGLGYRRLSQDEKWLIGLNTFADYEFPYDHKRASMGIEVKSTPLAVSVNKYYALTGWRPGPDGVYEHALDGSDLEVGLQLPYLPTSHLYARFYKWNGVEGLGELKGKEYSLEFAGLLADGLTLAAEHDAPDRAQSRDTISLIYKVHFGRDDKKIEALPLFSSQAFSFNSMRKRTLDKVRRENEIIKVQSGLTVYFR